MKWTGGVAINDAATRARRSGKVICGICISPRSGQTACCAVARETFIPRLGATRRVPPTGGVSSGAFKPKLRDRCANFERLNLEITRDQSEARSPHPVELANHLHRSPAADGVRRPVDRPPDAEEQRRRSRQASEAVQDPDYHPHGP